MAIYVCILIGIRFEPRTLPLGTRLHRNVLPKSHGGRKVSHLEERAPASPRESEGALQDLPFQV